MSDKYRWAQIAHEIDVLFAELGEAPSWLDDWDRARAHQEKTREAIFAFVINAGGNAVGNWDHFKIRMAKLSASSTSSIEGALRNWQRQARAKAGL